VSHRRLSFCGTRRAREWPRARYARDAALRRRRGAMVSQSRTRQFCGLLSTTEIRMEPSALVGIAGVGRAGRKSMISSGPYLDSGNSFATGPGPSAGRHFRDA